MLRTRTVACAVAVAAFATIALLPAQAQAAGSVHLHKIYYDSPGSDNRSNRSLNGEYVQITNGTSRAVNLRGWSVADASNHRYVFGSFTLGAGKTVTVRTGSGDDTRYTRYQDRRAYVWNNVKDKATLRKSGGAWVDSCSYNSSSVDYKMC